jgi:hypothetical protein
LEDMPFSGTDSQNEKMAAAAKRMVPFAKRAQAIGSWFGLYNHRNWGGYPEKLVAVCES